MPGILNKEGAKLFAKEMSKVKDVAHVSVLENNTIHIVYGEVWYLDYNPDRMFCYKNGERIKPANAIKKG